MYRSTCNAETFQPVSPGAAGPGCASTLPYMSRDDEWAGAARMGEAMTVAGYFFQRSLRFRERRPQADGGL